MNEDLVLRESYDKNTTQRLLYYDPNQVNGDLNLVKPLEDYCISVDLEVEIPSRENYITNDVYSLSWKSIQGNPNMTHANFFMGKKIGGTNVLTDFYTDLNFNSSKPSENGEAIGISSIDIDYDSWYLPKISINFVDLRGGALFNAAQYDDDVNGMSNNLFRAFFTFPYPMFKLQVKGFYGDAVTYHLYLTDFRGSFNAETGNFEISTTFISYTYAFLSDIQFNLLKSAPYNEKYGVRYWQNNVQSGRFRFTDDKSKGVAFPTLLELNTKIKNAQKDVNKLMSDDEDIVQYNRIKRNNSLLVTISNIWSDFLNRYYQANSNGTFQDVNFEAKFIAPINPYYIETPEIKSVRLMLENTINSYNSNNDFNDNIPIPSFEPIYTLITNDNSDEYIKENIDKVQGSDKYLVSLTYQDFINKINNIRDRDITQLNHSKNEIAGKIESIIQSHITFNPTINNIMKIIFAHLETFMQSYYDCLDRIKDSNRKIIDYFDKAEDTDVNTTDITNSALPPFPAVYQDNQEVWLGSKRASGKGVTKVGSDLLEEEKFVLSIIDSINTMVKAEDSLLEQVSTVSKEYWLPVNPFDTYITNKNNRNNPYNKFTNGNQFSDLIMQIGIRMFYGLALHKELMNDYTFMRRMAKCEAKNIYKAISSVRGLMDSFRSVSNIEDLFFKVMLGLRNNVNGLIINQLPDGRYNETNNFPGTQVMIQDSLKKSTSMSKGRYNTVSEFDVRTTSSKDRAPAHTYNFMSKKVGDYQSYTVLPLYSNTIDGYSDDWYCNTKNVTIQDDEYQPYYYHKEVGDRDAVNNNSIFKIIEEVKEYTDLKAKIDEDEPGYLSNWLIEVTDSTNYVDGKTYIQEVSFNEKTENDKNKIHYLPAIYGNGENKKIDKVDYTNVSLYSTFKTNNSSSSTYRTLRTNGGKYTLPFIGHIYEVISKKSQFWGIVGSEKYTYYDSIFGSSFYYGQNDKKNKERLKKDKEINKTINLSKASIFLSTFEWNKGYINSMFRKDNTAMIRRLPKSVVLRLGSMFWRLKYQKEYNIDPIYFPEFYEQQPMYHFLEKAMIKSDKNSKYTDDSISDKFSNILSDKNEILLREPIIQSFISYFTLWVDNYFSSITNELELRSTKGTTIMNSTTLTNIINNYTIKAQEDNLSIGDYYNDFGSNLFKNYIRILPQSSFNLLLVNRDDTTVNRYIIQLCSEDVCLVSTSYKMDKKSDGNNITLSTHTIETYLTALVSEMKNLVNEIPPTYVDNTAVSMYNNEAICLGLYKTLKNLYDKWCAWKKKDDFDYTKYVGEPNSYFKFIDKFYVDIGDKLIINLETFNDVVLTGSNSPVESLYSAITLLLERHQMLFIPTANNINWVEDLKTFERVFKPITFANKAAPNQDPGFTGIYVGQPSTILPLDTRKYNYQDDGMYIFPEANIPKLEDGSVTYPLPCFNVSYAKQNQSYFKNFTMNMNNPVNTDQSLQAVWNISQRGGGGSVAQGQDLYNVYTRNSYQVSVEMLGCAQIQAMTYFQLSNIPMYRGCYMIYKVNHKITPGNMITSFTGMRMSKVSPMLTKDAFTFKSFLSDFDDINTNLRDNFNYSNSDSNVRTIYANENNITQNGSSTSLSSNKEYYGITTDVPVLNDEKTYWNYVSAKNYMLGKYLKVKDIVEKSVGNKSTGLSFDEVGSRMPYAVFLNALTLSAQLDRIFQWVEDNHSDSYLHIESFWRSKYHDINHSTFHGIGSAVDLHVKYKKDNSKNPKAYKELFQFIKNNLPYNQLMFESAGSSYWVHYAYHNGSKRNYLDADYKA